MRSTLGTLVWASASHDSHCLVQINWGYNHLPFTNFQWDIQVAREYPRECPPRLPGYMGPMLGSSDMLVPWRVYFLRTQPHKPAGDFCYGNWNIFYLLPQGLTSISIRPFHFFGLENEWKWWLRWCFDRSAQWTANRQEKTVAGVTTCGYWSKRTCWAVPREELWFLAWTGCE